MLQFTDIQAAAARIKGHAHRTPVLTSRTLDELLGAQVFMKAENLQRMGAFKFRGGYNSVSVLSDEQRARGVVAFSSGKPRAGGRARGAAARLQGHHRDAARCARAEARGHARATAPRS
jgi:threonine dehydratase